MDRVNGVAALVLAYDADDAIQRARGAYPDRLAPDAAFLASAPLATAILAGDRPPGTSRLALLE